ncbi:MAG TPA: CHASE2 domain-containing protein [Candidatus Ozemobacteraceae bacterium]|nr:CHASE2 domain-containing protein [Candidatus Ozemobacteraceae bacterium]
MSSITPTSPGSGEEVTRARLEALLGRKRLLSWIAAAAAVLLVVAGIPDLGAGFDRAALDLVTRLATPWRAPHPDLVIVGIDTETLAAVTDRWPWPRDRYARLLAAVGAAGPRAIVFDILLQHLEPADGGAGDRALAETLRRLGNVHLISLLERQETEFGRQKRHFRSAPLFRQAAAGEGFVWAWVDPDGIVRSFVLRDGQMELNSCALSMARLLGSEPSPLPPPDEEGRSRGLIAFAGRGGAVPTLSARDFLEGRIPAGALTGKTVFLGVTAPILHDFHRTCHGLMAGTRLLSACTDTLVQRRLIVQHEGRGWRLVLVLLGFLAGAGLVRARPNRPWSALTAGTALGGLGWALALFAAGHALPPFPLLAGLLVAGLSGIALVRLVQLLSLQTLQAEAAAAGQVQRQLFPPPIWNSEEYTSYGCCQPCSAAGGDYFDVLPVGEEETVFLVNDVAGHGIGAAMVASILKASITLQQDRESFSLDQAVDRLNALLFRLFRGRKMVTGVFCRLEHRAHRLTLISAGHVASMIVRAGGTVEEIGKPGLPLGVRAATRVIPVEMEFFPGDTLVLYTDGVVEMIDRQGAPLGYPAWKDLLAARAPLVPNAETVGELLGKVRAHGQGLEPGDDVTLLLLHRRAAATAQEKDGRPEE